MQLGLTLRVGGATRTEQQRQCQRERQVLEKEGARELLASIISVRLDFGPHLSGRKLWNLRQLLRHHLWNMLRHQLWNLRQLLRQQLWNMLRHHLHTPLPHLG
eukprot:COSAG02_NODE_8189_length_2668_cov_496.662125_1_plen_103_part_00